MTAKQRAARAKFKAVVAEAKKLRKKNPKLTQAQAVKQAWAMSYNKKNNKVGAVKKKTAKKYDLSRGGMTVQRKPKKGAKPDLSYRGMMPPLRKKSKKASEMHTDTKSHNVNIRVMSGVSKIGESALDHLNKLVKQRRDLAETIEILKGHKKKAVGQQLKNHYAKWINLYKKEDAKLRTQVAFAKKFVK